MTRRLGVPALLLLVLASCARKTTAPAVATDAAPVADSPSNAVRRIMWGWQHRDVAAATDLMAEDYLFNFQEADSAGNAYRDRPWGNEDERICAQHLFVGGGDMPAASEIQLVIDSKLRPNPDPRPGREVRWHQTIFTQVDLKVTIDGPGGPTTYPVTGQALFYLVRGDSAQLSLEQIQRGGRDSTRWYCQRWDDMTIGTNSPGTGANPSQTYTWAHLKALYR